MSATGDIFVGVGWTCGLCGQFVPSHISQPHFCGQTQYYSATTSSPTLQDILNELREIKQLLTQREDKS